jgi:hypothetical protein
MKREEKYEGLRQFFLDNFETTTNIHDRLHTKDIINIALNNKFLFSDCKIAEVFKSMNIGQHKKQCNIYCKIQTGYYYVIYKGASDSDKDIQSVT